MPQPPSHCQTLEMLIRPSAIHLLRFILEAYEGIGVVTTLDARLGLVRLSIAPGCGEEVQQILAAEAERLEIRPVEARTNLLALPDGIR